jgi:hypothetical protein
MFIGSIDVGYRQKPFIDNPSRVVLFAETVGGTVVRRDRNIKFQDVSITLAYITDAVKDSLKTYLMDTIRPYGTATVEPDPPDDLGIGASGEENLIWFQESFQAEWIAHDKWNVSLIFRKYF